MTIFWHFILYPKKTSTKLFLAFRNFFFPYFFFLKVVYKNNSKIHFYCSWFTNLITKIFFFHVPQTNLTTDSKLCYDCYICTIIIGYKILVIITLNEPRFWLFKYNFLWEIRGGPWYIYLRTCSTPNQNHNNYPLKNVCYLSRYLGWLGGAKVTFSLAWTNYHQLPCFKCVNYCISHVLKFKCTLAAPPSTFVEITSTTVDHVFYLYILFFILFYQVPTKADQIGRHSKIHRECTQHLISWGIKSFGHHFKTS